MKKRLITGILSLILPVLALVFLNTPLLGLFIVAAGAIVSHEICHAAQIKNKAMLITAVIGGGITPLLFEYNIPRCWGVPFTPLLFLWTVLLVVIWLLHVDETKGTDVLLALIASVGVPGAISSLTLIRRVVMQSGGAVPPEKNIVVYMVFFTMCSTWLTDSFAYFVGRKLGKHKMAPKISPNKTIEGALGGILGTVLVNTIFAIVFNALILRSNHIQVLGVALLSIPLGVLAEVGDLTASALKRNCGVKDFGKLLPGHGGVLDRVDSLLFTGPCVCVLLELQITSKLPIFFK